MLNSENSQVEVVKDDGEKTRWYQGRFYRKEGNKYVFDSEKAKYYILGAFLVLTIGVFFKDVPDDEIVQTTSLDVPTRVSNYQEDIVLDSYSDTKERKATQKAKKKVIEKLSIVSSNQKVEIPLGTQARGVLVTGGTDGPVKVKLLEDLESYGEVYIKEGAVLWGMGSSTEKRLLVNFTKFVDEDGKEKEISANAFDISDQIIGIKGSIVGRRSKQILAGAGLGVAGALKTIQQSENLGGVAVVKPNLKNALLNGASDATLGIAEQELEELKNKQTTVEVPKGTRALIVFGGI